MDSFRKQLDVLMGANRNGDVKIINRNYYDRDVCRLFLSGLCPHELFQLTVISSNMLDCLPPPLLDWFCFNRAYEFSSSVYSEIGYGTLFEGALFEA